MLLVHKVEPFSRVGSLTHNPLVQCGNLTSEKNTLYARFTFFFFS